ncbi:efflux RND transporter permease subunit [Catenisphaera adipataccumulans]|uniref:Membrane transport protein MMPL domain-containing protein n=1 Tax=Catenisphaera adipataccumulans TaxID=700500 RepID=A0A7W8CUU0_9FIRM|nr:MMPL family transporter [Catenisphaera adipataccumulans]MBB5182046.1 hypothetical protein [Catenisphaera adipataccumulans]
MEKISDFIVRFRNQILVLAILLLIPSYFGYVNTKVNYDLLSYLPQSSESMKAQKILGDDFNLASVDFLVVNGMKDKDVAKLEEKIQKIDGVDEVYWRDDAVDITIPKEALPQKVQDALYSDGATMMIITFKEGTSSTRTMDAITQIKKTASKDCYLAGTSAISEDTKDMVDREMPVFSAIAVALVLVVLWLGLESNFAPFVFMLGIMFPIIYNFGTNVFLGQISYITKALAMVLQLAVTMDYSIFLLHRYQEEKQKNDSNEKAMSKAIQATFVSISSSSITTIAGFVALCVMQLTLGRDIGIVMAKGVVLGVVSTIIVLPSLLMIFDKQIERRKHKVLIRPMTRLPRWVINHRKQILIGFICVMIPMTYAQANTKKYYNLIDNMPQNFNSIIGTNQLKEKFHMTTTHFILVDDSVEAKDIEKICDEIDDVDGIRNTIAYEQIVGPAVSNAFEPEAVEKIFHNGHYKLIIANSDYKGATSKENKQLDQIDKIIKKYDKNAVIGGEGAMERDLITTTDVDFQVVNVLSIVLIFIIIAFTFKSFSLPIILVLTIEFAININMGIPYFTGTVLPFIAGIVIGTIQLGATVDYAILLTTRFREELEKGKEAKRAIGSAMKHSSTSIMTSGFSFFAACIGVAAVADMDLLKSMCFLLARGALISVACILIVLPSFLLTFHKFIEKTTKNWPKAVVEKGRLENVEE